MSTKSIIKQIANKNGVTTSSVRADLREAMKASMSSPNPEAKEFWRQLDTNGKEPSVDEFLKFCIKTAKFRMSNKL